MTRLGRIVVTIVVAAVLVGATAVVAHFLRPPAEQTSEPSAPPPETVETPTGTGEAAGTPSGSAAARGTRQPAPESGGEAGSAAPAPPADRERPDQGRRPSPSSAGTKRKAGRAERTGRPAADGQASGGAEADGPSGESAGNRAAQDALALVEDRPLVAQKRLSEALKAGVRSPLADLVHQAVRRLADRVQLSGICRPGDTFSKRYTVESGDTLTAIGQRYLIPYPLIMKLNGLETTDIRAGQTLKVLQGPIHVEVLKGRYQLRAWLGDVCLRVYPVAIGKNNSTPEGTFNVKNKVKNPPYQPQHKSRSEFRAAGAPDNPLGTRWIDLGNHYGIHGTIEPDSVGHDVSEGCIRMHNKHVEELYDMVVVGASKVYIRP